MLNENDLQNIRGVFDKSLDEGLDRKFEVFEGIIDKKIDAKFEIFGKLIDHKIDAKIDAAFEKFAIMMQRQFEEIHSEFKEVHRELDKKPNRDEFVRLQKTVDVDHEKRIGRVERHLGFI